jgi:hypothetical protein
VLAVLAAACGAVSQQLNSNAATAAGAAFGEGSHHRVALLQVLLASQGCSSCWQQQQQGMACSHANTAGSRLGLISNSNTCTAGCWLKGCGLQPAPHVTCIEFAQLVTDISAVCCIMPPLGFGLQCGFCLWVTRGQNLTGWPYTTIKHT